jgi:octaprenyl-diphosphate synthase
MSLFADYVKDMAIMQATSSPQAPSTAQTAEVLRASVSADFDAVNSLITDELFSDVPLIQEVARYIVRSGGKRLRPLLVLLSAKACGYSGDEHIELATVIEFIHTATLLHDDVVDKSTQRRGRETANALWGNQASVLVGDFLYSRAFQLLAKRSNVPVTKILADATNAISEGEVLQLLNSCNPDATEKTYLNVISRKTAELFKSAAHIGAIVGSTLESTQTALRDFGHNLGMAYQIVDDVLDYTADTKNLGKNLGDDLAEGKPTLPLLHAMHHCGEPVRHLIRNIISGDEPGMKHFDTICSVLKKTNAYDYCFSLAEQYIQKAKGCLDHLSDSSHKTALLTLCDFTLERSH